MRFHPPRLSPLLAVIYAGAVPVSATLAGEARSPQGAGKPYYCEALPRADWLSAAELKTRLEAQGLQLIQIRLADDKCYRVGVRDAQGFRRDLLVHPVTAEVVGPMPF